MKIINYISAEQKAQEYMNIRSIASHLWQRARGYKTKLETATLLGKELSVNEGTITGKTDKDDAWFYALAAHHHVIFDIGCNIGYASLLATVNNPEKCIVLADPNPLALSYAAGNLIRNSLSANKMFLQAFVGAESGEKVKFYTVGAGAAGSMFASAAQTASKLNAFYWVDTLSIDEIVSKTALIPDLVKIDIEGAESYALQGAKELASKKQTHFMVEMHAPAEMPMAKNAELVLNWCKENSYQAYYMTEHKLLTNAEQIAHRGRCHLLLIPIGDTYPVYLQRIKEGNTLPA